MDLFTFLILATLLIGTAMAVVLHPSPVYSALALVTLMILLAVYFLFLDAHMIGALQIIVYAGAVMVLFLFVIMLLNLQSEAQDFQRREVWVAVGTFSVLFVGGLGFFLARGRSGLAANQQQVAEGFGTVRALSERLFTDFLLPFEITSILLLVAAVGAVVLARRQA